MANLKEKINRIINHHATAAAKAAALRQEWQNRMKFEIGQEILKDERYGRLRSHLREFPDWGWDPDWGWEETDELYKKMEADDVLLDLVERLDIRTETLLESILFAAYIDREYGSFEKHLDEVRDVWFRTELARLKPKSRESEEEIIDED